MEIKAIYESVSYITPMEAPKFINFFNQTIREILNKYKSKYVYLPGTSYQEIEALDDGINIYDFYETPIIDNIIYLAAKDSNKKTDFTAHAEYAYLNAWKTIHANRLRLGEISEDV